MDDYPIYYDAVYYPQYAVSSFESSERFCEWLSRSLSTHHTICAQCRLRQFCGHVFYDGNTVLVGDRNTFVCVTLQTFESVSYTHCSLLRHLSEIDNVSFSSRWRSRKDLLPNWFFHGVKYYEDNLSVLTYPTLLTSVRNAKLSCTNRSKKQLISAVVHYLTDLRRRMMYMNSDQLLSVVSGEFDCDFLPSLLSSHMRTVLGTDVATVLHVPSQSVYSLGTFESPHLEWASVSQSELLSRLNGHGVPFQQIVQCISRLPEIGRPSVDTRYHRRTQTGLLYCFFTNDRRIKRHGGPIPQPSPATAHAWMKLVDQYRTLSLQMIQPAWKHNGPQRGHHPPETSPRTSPTGSINVFQQRHRLPLQSPDLDKATILERQGKTELPKRPRC